ncbi:DUF3757 domain-containing protein [Dyella sp. M7H15-1]|nr:DUF3757 domain-containing protein [Dyella sp. M7H15-1]
MKAANCSAGSSKGCKYEIDAAQGITWIGSDRSSRSKNEQISVKFLEANAKVTNGKTQIFCDYGFFEPNGTDTKDGLRLSLKNPEKITLSDKWQASKSDEPSSCQSQSPNECTFTPGS